ncbi:geranylgeranyl hydrogenase BchP [Hymenobacter qilianensis]|uniref:Geranylgeranyl hydrogenase BchP n=2 Tax=Hymenobacter qilianensis TaxID=1385715 RepID=A0ACB5PQ94_9BACT|nr:geranylgeranyl reductase family protein [Hymenobacter qilianensis]QNP52953.1 geranylgeranyl reductase family protein [Hymenobacter qilianensis]GGF61189.1 geranylgeranyl hydrogenase BchP [Hymenobacter qilianensis]
MTNHYDVVILGAGPAGTACALALQNSGLRVALVDKDRFPRDKVCGDAIPGLALKAIRKLSPALYEELYALPQKAETRDSRLFAPSGDDIRVRWQIQTFNSPRLHFDARLLAMVRAHTETHVQLAFPVKDMHVSAEQVTLLSANGQAPLTCQLLIGCDGANSVAARKLTQRPLDRAHQCVAVRAYFQGLTNTDETTTEFYFLREYLAGYFWIFPVGNGVYNVGFGMLSSDVAAQKLDLKKVLLAITREHPQVAPRFAQASQLSEVSGFGLPLGGKSRPISGARFLLCGDAASLIDPLQGHGIDTAIQSGILAAKQAVRCFEQQDFSAAQMHWYEQAVYQQIGKKLARSYRLMRFISSKPWLVNAGFGLARNAWVKKWLLKVVG